MAKPYGWPDSGNPIEHYSVVPSHGGKVTNYDALTDAKQEARKVASEWSDSANDYPLVIVLAYGKDKSIRTVTAYRREHGRVREVYVRES